MKILLTGASGYVGGVVLDELLHRNHSVLVTARSTPPPRWRGMPGLTVLPGDLNSLPVDGLRSSGIECAIHLAAALSGDAEQQARDTVRATSTLIAALRTAGISRLVGVSSIAVLDYVSRPKMALIDEQVPVASEASGMSDYARCKLQQEQLFLEFGRAPAHSCVIVRPGLIYDGGRLSAAYAGIFAGPLGVLVRHAGEVPTAEVHAVARGIVAAAELNISGCEIIHLVDDHLPRQADYIAGLRRRGQLPAARVSMPRFLIGALAKLLGAVRGGKAPEITSPQSFAGRLGAFRYSNDKAKRLLGWQPVQSFS